MTWNHVGFFIDGLPDQSSEEANQNCIFEVVASIDMSRYLK